MENTSRIFFGVVQKVYAALKIKEAKRLPRNKINILHSIRTHPHAIHIILSYNRFYDGFVVKY